MSKLKDAAIVAISFTILIMMPVVMILLAPPARPMYHELILDLTLILVAGSVLPFVGAYIIWLLWLGKRM